MIEHVDVLMTRLPSADGEFVELEDDKGRGLGPENGAEWVERENGLVALRIPATIFGPRPIQPGDLVERIGYDLDDREVIAVGRDWLTLDIGGETERLPKDNYRTTVPVDGVL